MPKPTNPRAADPITRRAMLGSGAIGALALASKATPARAVQDDAKPSAPPTPAAYIDGTGHGWVTLGEKDFVNVNSADDTWRWEDGVLYCTGQPISVLRSAKLYTNLEISFEWNHRRPAGNSGLFVWADKEKVEAMTKAGKPGLPTGIEVQVLDPAFRPNEQGTWFSCHGDVFPVGQTMTPFPPLSNNGKGPRSFPSEDRVKPSGNWNHYYVRAINGEIRLWVNGKEVSGGNNCSTTTGYLCLESEGSPIEFRNLRLRELP
ncbi:MAG: DUF1080 domain-containing protein [Phycisphaeraceae bacterium]